MSSASKPTVVVAPTLADQRVNFHTIAAEFGLSIGDSEEFDTAAVAVLCDLGNDPLKAIQVASDQHPSAKIIGCARFSANIDFHALTESGLYHFLNVPIESAELRQSMGFLAASIETEKTRHSFENREVAHQERQSRGKLSRYHRCIGTHRDRQARHG